MSTFPAIPRMLTSGWAWAAIGGVLLGSGCKDEAAEALMTCAGGNVEACYRDGMAATSAARPQFGEARKSFSTACLGGNAPTSKAHHGPSCFELAQLVRDARGGPKDLVRAADLFGIACKEGVARACVDHGLALYNGDGVKENAARAVELFTPACTAEPNDATACKALGDAFAAGKGVEKKDEDRALELYQMACKTQNAEACVAAGNLMQASRSGNRKAEAAANYLLGCELDARTGCFELAQLHESGKWDGASFDEASKYYQKTCNIDPTRGCYEAAELMHSNKVNAREGEIEYLYNLACEHGKSQACDKRNIERGE